MLTLATKTAPENSPTAAERRRGLRIRQCRPVKIYEPRTSRYFPGRTADISATGLRLSLPLSVPIIPGSTVSLHIGMDKPGDALATRRHMLDARIIWTRRDQSDGQLIAGLELLTSAAAQAAA
jgi:PilZ domain